MGNNQKSFGLTRSKKILIFLFLSLFIIAGFVFIENPVYSFIYGFIYKDTKINIKSDAELISEFQAHKEEFSRLIQQIRQIENERQQFENEKSSKLFDTIDSKRKVVDQALQKLGYLEHRHYVAQGQIVIPQKRFYYQEGHLFSNLVTSYGLVKGLILFDENMQPDKSYIVDSLDSIHSSGNIVLSTRKFISKFGQKGTIFVHIEGNLYLFLGVSYSPDHYPNSLDYEY
ncbi:MAG TPA: hypothetical protein PKY82_28910 [Pyrinomonadaceae bacterium]|nr:hypothetical protein [Pyrinomonadaceae bacterium]